MSHRSIMPGEFWFIESHGTVTIKVFHILDHYLGKIEGDRGCVGSPVKPSYLRWVPKSCFWATLSWFIKSNGSISICVTPFEVWKVVVANDFGIEILIAINFWNSLNNLIKVYVGCWTSEMLNFRDRSVPRQCPPAPIRWSTRLLKLEKWKWLTS